ncbi:QcrA and Rieske domain-containing protein [Polyangium jinanense]|uniref:Rieske 2Fe-2S domain-containing protein n=1 Tax=Polyangium jinanense TaxID=2829994 RepID=A0A9X4AXG4_9BACT|nr:Rieske 2Fe-2S domain-containing protein [Polyangium jinanense]MDC3962086.1 Rieske 2Fe-2S domain-containing protein [Polyangium jinanense]MDC3988369.1 Rieske 2Fe-2S domain-containing protein [Polyangium jinanense]
MAENDDTSEGGQERWREDFPIGTLDDRYVARREFAKSLTIGSALLVLVNGAIAAVARWVRKPAQIGEEARIGKASDLPTGGSMLFRYPTDEDPCILVRTQSGSLRAYSQVCTHLSCAVVHQPREDEFLCPCHRGRFDVNDGRPVGGPPLRRLPRVWIEQRGDDVFAVGRDS